MTNHSMPPLCKNSLVHVTASVSEAVSHSGLEIASTSSLAMTFSSPVSSRRRLSDPLADRKSYLQIATRPSSFLISYLLFLFIILIATFLRLYYLPSLPPGLNFDEAGSGVAALEILNGAPKIWWRLGGGQEPLWPYLTAVTTSIWGNVPLSLRLPAVLAGILTIAAVYRLVLTLFTGYGQNRYWLALFAAAGLALSDWHLHFSRLGFRAILLPLFSALAFHFFWQVVSRQKIYLLRFIPPFKTFYVPGLALAALFTALAVYSYLAARLLLFIPVIFLTLQLLIHRRLAIFTKTKSSPLASSSLLTPYYLLLTLFLAPLILYFAFNPADLVARSATVSIFNPQWNHGDLFGTVWQTLGLTAGTFFGLTGDANPLVNLPGQPALPLILIPFFGLGLLISLYNAFPSSAHAPSVQPATLQPSPHLLLLCWWLVMLLPAILAPEGAPHHLRLLGTIIPTYAFIAIGLVGVTNFLHSSLSTLPSPRLAPLPLTTYSLLPATCCLILAFQTYNSYFIRWPASVDFTLPFDLYAVRLADDIAHAPPESAYVLPMDVRAGDEARHYTLDYLLNWPHAAAYTYIPVDEPKTPTLLTQAARGKSELRVVRWTQDKHQEADAKEIVTYLLETTARLRSQAKFPVYTIETYTLPTTTTTFTLPVITQTLKADFTTPDTGQAALRLEAAFVPITVVRGSWLPVAVTLAPLAPMSTDYKASLRLVNQASERVSQKDRDLLHNYHQGTSLWPAEMVNEYYLLPLPPHTPPGEYTVTLLIYQPDSLAPLLVNGSPELPLGQVRLK